MACPGVLQSPGWKQWWRKSSNTCFSKKILLLLVWKVLYSFSWNLFSLDGSVMSYTSLVAKLLPLLLAPFLGWLADVKFGRYKVLIIGSFAVFFATIFYYFGLFTGVGISTISNVTMSVAISLVIFGVSCFSGAMLPFLTDQLIGPTSDDLSSVVRWYYWAGKLGIGLSEIIMYLGTDPNYAIVNVGLAGIFAVPLAVIIISDCLCQQWLDKTHKITNPIKLIIQVLNYTRKHSYPERRSAFTYIDEEQPIRMDYGKEKFGGPFTEEEVEDVKTVLRLLPIMICLSLSVGSLSFSPVGIFNDDENTLNLLSDGLIDWLIPLLLIPFYQLILRRCVHGCTPSMLRCIGAGLFVYIVGFVLLQASGIYGILYSDDVQRYLSCTALNMTTSHPDIYAEWYWKLSPGVLYGIGDTVSSVLMLEFVIAQSPDKMKGLVFGLMLAFNGIVNFVHSFMLVLFFTLCYDMVSSVALVVLFVVFLVLSEHYTLRERNREINIQAITEEHYERYMDQEEEYMRENPQYFESLDSDSD